MKIRVGFIYYHPYPENRGVQQVISLLNKLNIEVDIVALYIRKDKLQDTISLNNYYGILNEPNKLREFYYKAFPFYNNWVKKLTKLSQNRKWNLIFVRESLLANSCIVVGKKNNIPVILDMRENRPDMILSNSFGLKKIIAFMYSKIVKMFENKYLPKFKHIFTVSNELKDWTEKNYNIENKKVTILANYPNSQIISSSKKFRKSNYSLINKNLRLVFAGHVNYNRGLQYIIPALAIMNKKGLNTSLHIIGNGSYISKIKSLTNKYRLNKKVYFHNLIDPSKLMETLAQYDIGLTPYLINKHTSVTVPGKLFEYMAIGLPILSSPRMSVTKIIDKHNCGLYYETFAPEEIANKISILFDQNVRENLGKAGINSIENIYNENTSLRLLKSVLARYPLL